MTRYFSFRLETQKEKIDVKKAPQSAVESRRTAAPSSAKMNQTLFAANIAAKLAPKRTQSSRVPCVIQRETDPHAAVHGEFGSVLCRILSNIAATPDLDDDFTIRKRALEARERRLIRARDDRYFKLVEQLTSPREPEIDTEDFF